MTAGREPATALTAAQEIRLRVFEAAPHRTAEDIVAMAEVLEHGLDNPAKLRAWAEQRCEHCPGEDVRHVEERQILRTKLDHVCDVLNATQTERDELRDRLRDTDADLEFARGRINHVVELMDAWAPHMISDIAKEQIRAILTDEATP